MCWHCFTYTNYEKVNQQLKLRCMSLQPPPFSAALSLGLSFSACLVLSNEPSLEFGADQEPEKNVFEGVTYVVSDN